MNVSEVANLKRQIEERYRRDIEAVDRVLALLGEQPEKPATTRVVRENPSNGAARVPKKTTGFGRERDAGMPGIAKKALPYVPTETFGRKELIETIHAQFPDQIERTTKDAMNGAVARLLEDGFIEQVQVGQGKRPALYQKLHRTAAAA